MKGAKIQYKKLGELLRTKRTEAGYDLEMAATLLGLTNGSYLASCEVGRCNFPFSKLGRAQEVYSIKTAKLAEVASEDYRIGLLEALK